ncbi:MAG: hypothetical protein C4532_18115 [Candidatus Abyssobacteria bacterium SURF_17]|uniref:DUF5320 domain-containing protein n=1 Tax=Candidatus Abyssobacteria bacterium SURF_17 TaxID=2093361 RepID=A0A419EPW7_9BACT|nr:MAG: hypothetical protein C4532_18115 [Candidatus Abyssubacteria bacterium SURF_17]
MPRGDGTGPAGLGPMTGRGAGYCAGFSTPGFANPVPGRGGWGRGRGRGYWGAGGGRGWRHWYYATGVPGWARAGWGFGPPAPYWPPVGPSMTKDQEAELLSEQAKDFTEALEEIKKRLEELSAKEK